MKAKDKQLAFETILADSFKQHERRMLAYMLANKAKYQGLASVITPSLKDSKAIYLRLAFAILSANSPFAASCEALKVANEKPGKIRWQDLSVLSGMTPGKAEWCNTVYWNCQRDPKQYLKAPSETWQGYRLRLAKTVKGLGLAKASFAACLLYPLTADLACIDTWMEKVFLGYSSFKQLNLATYELVESKVRAYANKLGCNTFLAQWMIWDHARGEVNTHAIFPGSHK